MHSPVQHCSVHSIICCFFLMYCSPCLLQCVSTSFSHPPDHQQDVTIFLLLVQPPSQWHWRTVRFFLWLFIFLWLQWLILSFWLEISLLLCKWKLSSSFSVVICCILNFYVVCGPVVTRLLLHFGCPLDTFTLIWRPQENTIFHPEGWDDFYLFCIHKAHCGTYLFLLVNKKKHDCRSFQVSQISQTTANLPLL